MMKQFLFLAFFLSPVFGFCAEKSDAILGTWLTQIADAKIEIYKKANQYYGRVIWLAEPNDKDGKPVVDENNPDPLQKKRPIYKMDILIDLEYDNDGEWDGKIYDPKDGKIYTCKLWIVGSQLKVRGYLGWLFDTKTWTRV